MRLQYTSFAKILLFVAIIGSVSIGAVCHVEANPVFGKAYPLKQPDGTVLQCLIWGDEYHRRVEMPNGFSIVPNQETGWYEYARLENGRLAPSGLIAGYAGRAELAQAGLVAHLTDRHAVAGEALQRKQQMLNERTEMGVAPSGAAAGPLKGTFKNLVICVDFKSEPDPPNGARHKYATSLFKTALYATTGKSMVTYYKENSYGLFAPTGYVYPNWIVLPRTATYYKGLSNGWRKIIIDAMDVIRAKDPSFDFTKWANAGVMKPIIIWAGMTEGWSDFFWPHQADLTLTKYGVDITGYLAVNEQDNSTGNANTDIGVFCHEFCHMIGGPDLYDYDAFQTLPNGFYCLMGIGSGTTHICGWVKWKYFSWVNPTELTTASNGKIFSVSALALQSPTKPQLYRAKINGSETEYFLIENRKDGSAKFENFSYGSWTRDSGLQITHVDEKMIPQAYPWIVNLGFSAGYPAYSHKFFAVEAITPTLPVDISDLMDYLYLWQNMTFSNSIGQVRLTPTFPIDKPAGKFATLKYTDQGSVVDTEHVIFPNSNGHTAPSNMSFTNISNSGNTMTFKYGVQ